MSGEPLLSAEDVRASRGGKLIVRGVSLEASGGEILGILGPSGAGKSTFFRTLTGETPLDSGRVRYGTQDVTAWPLWRRARGGLGYVPQTPSVLWDLSVADNLRVFAHVAEREGKPGAEPADDLATRLDLTSRLDVRAGELSGGERRRLELARALTLRPRILICDEPFAGVDPKNAEQLGDLLRAEAERGVAVLLADHHVAEALRVCTRALLLLDGEVAVDADPDAFREHPLVLGRYLGSWTRSLPPPPRA
ncbi:MAG: ATP-binding cassette domain-containing protein [Myxococcales bacterium]|nr:ATP-binding cassette domain-containing protein [Myxococcales bacterium]